MQRRARPRRSVLYMPGSNGRALEKAKTLVADGLIFDLEDAVAPDAKATARQQVCEAVRTGGYGRRERIVRVNGLTTLWGREDLAAGGRRGGEAGVPPQRGKTCPGSPARGILSAAWAPEDPAG